MTALPPRGSARLERRGYDRAVAHELALTEQFADGAPSSVALPLTLAALCVLGFVLPAAALVFGAVLVIGHPSFWLVNVGIFLVILAFVFRPRFGKAPGRAVDPASVPLLHDLVEQVATVAGLSVPHRIVLDLSDITEWTRSGLRGRSTLRLGAARWAALAPQLRVALLAQELAGARDPNRGQLVRPVVTTYESLVRALHAERTWSWLRRRDRPRGNLVLTVGQRLLWLVSRPFVPPFVLLRIAALRCRLQAGHVAAGLAEDVAGTDACVALADRDTCPDEIDRVVFYAAAHRRPSGWPAAVDAWVSSRAAEFPQRREESAETISTWDARLPAGRRAQLLIAGTHRRPRVVASPARALDEELAAWLDVLHTDLLGSREFVERRTTPSS